MKLISHLYDNRIKAKNILFEMTIEEYYSLSEAILDNNKFQRRRVKSSSTVYSLLKKDLVIGCVIPPIVLALSDKDFKNDEKYKNSEYEDYIKFKREQLIILDGLQRTFTIRELYEELSKSDDNQSFKELKETTLRIEIYLGMSKTDILYRMLTLNTGQTPMSMRHQIEILYSDYLDKEIDGITLLMESNDKSPIKQSEYKFKDVVEGFNSYLDRDYLPMDRNTILENIKSLDKLSLENRDEKDDLFLSYLKTFDNFIKVLSEKSNDWEFNEETLDTALSSSPFGKDTTSLFKKSQVMTGFGSAVGKLIDFNAINKLNDLNSLIDEINIYDANNTFNNLIITLDQIRRVATKIGNDQRLFFHHFFRGLFDKKSDSYLDLGQSVEEAYSMYLRKTQ